MPLDPDTFRAVLGRFASGVTVVTTCDDAGRDHGMTVSAFCSLSLEPPLVLVCVDHVASMHPLLVVGTRVDCIGCHRGLTGAPLLDDVLASMEGRIVRTHEGGDHTIVVIEVEVAS